MDYSPFNPVIWLIVAGFVAVTYLTVKITRVGRGPLTRLRCAGLTGWKGGKKYEEIRMDPDDVLSV